MVELDYDGIVEKAYDEVAWRFEERFWGDRVVEDWPTSNALLYLRLHNIRREMFDVLDRNR